MAWGVDIRESRTIASSEQEAASKLVLIPETVSRCLLSLTQAFDGRVTIDARFQQSRSDSLIRGPYEPRATVGPRRAIGGPCASATSQAAKPPFPYEPCTVSRIVASLAVCPPTPLASPSQ